MGLAGVGHMWVIYTLLCIYAVGAVFNGWILMAILGDHRRLLQTRIDKITAALIVTIFVWALGRVLITALVLFNVVYVFGNVIAGFSNIVVIGLFGLNLLLAIERFIQIKDIHYSNIIYSTFAVVIGIFCVLIVAIFATTPSSDGFRPSTQPQKAIWFVITGFSYIVTIGCMLSLYIWTFSYCTKQFQRNPNLVAYFLGEHNADAVDKEELRMTRLKLERQILVKSVIISGSLIICYIPFFFYELAGWVAGPNFDPNAIFYDISIIFLTFDVCVTPSVVLYVRRDLSQAMLFWKNEAAEQIL
ncbi:hypothetical protein HK100_010253 [Physocladia obscura]|uniref:G protein-coupled receptor n=1 Tax=Physocladia obscura TaxID=109957 RepID=A0AAD5T8X3_9FUNG|nr:hypothetical protein HK100_010253 [Physocladia obscura]